MQQLGYHLRGLMKGPECRAALADSFTDAGCGALAASGEDSVAATALSGDIFFAGGYRTENGKHLARAYPTGSFARLFRDEGRQQREIQTHIGENCVIQPHIAIFGKTAISRDRHFLEDLAGDLDHVGENWQRGRQPFFLRVC